MRPLREVINEFLHGGRALGHFNISDSNQLRAIALASKETSLPVIVGLSEGERQHLSLREARGLVDAFNKEGVAIYLNADHTYGIEKAKEAIDAGVDSIVVDGAHLPLEENIALVKEAVAYAHASGKTLVEGELGYIGSASRELESLPEGVSVENLTSADDAKKFVEATGVDCFAPAVGNVHGMLKNAKEPRLHPERVAEIAKATGIPLVLHGASGNTPEDIAACIKAGVAIVHINTELRLLYRKGLEKSLAGHPDEAAPYKYLEPAEEEMKAFLVDKMQLFTGTGVH
jgi:fructose-bisphosphate aldolase class II